MLVDTRRVQGRRKLHYNTLDDLLADAEALASGEIKQMGNWSPGRTFQHIARALHTSVDGSPLVIPWPVKLLLRTMKRRFLTRTLDPGFKLRGKASDVLTPDAAVGVKTGLAQLREAVQRLKQTEVRAPHSFLGVLTREESDAFHLRHAEMHMSFLAPINRGAEQSSGAGLGSGTTAAAGTWRG